MDESFRLQPQFKPTKSLNYQERVKAGLQRGGLRKVSEKKQQWANKYIASIKKDEDMQMCCFGGCNVYNHKDFMSRHHPKGQHEENILNYDYYCQEHHAWIHANPNEARKLGYLEM